MITRKCKQCLKEFLPKRLSTAVFCSVKCGGKNWVINNKEQANQRRVNWRRRQGMLGRGSVEHREKARVQMLGTKQSKETIEKRFLNLRGSNHWRWILDRTKLVNYGGSEERRSPIYKDWRKRVWVRDNWKCKIDNHDCNGRIEAHHILSYTNYPELRYEINNGITLCHAHHPRKRAEEKLMMPVFQELLGVSIGN